MITWNYRVVRHHYYDPSCPRLDETYHQIHSVYYDAKGKPTGISTEAHPPMGNSDKELYLDLVLMNKAFEKEILDYRDLVARVELPPEDRDHNPSSCEVCLTWGEDNDPFR